MKKLISLLLLMIMICSTMVGCTKSEDIPYICYTADESLTSLDVDFLNEMTIPKGNTELGVLRDEPQLGYIIYYENDYDYGNHREGELLYIANNMDGGYYLCLYSSKSFAKTCFVALDRLLGTDFSSKYFTWYRFDNCSYEDIPRELDGKELIDVYFLCESVIKRDLVAGKDYNINFTFYYNVGVIEADYHYTGTQMINAFVYPKMLIYRSFAVTDNYFDDSKHLFMTVYFRDTNSAKRNDFWIYTDDNGVEYWTFQVYHGLYGDGRVDVHDDALQRELLDYYDVFLPYFERLEELDSERHHFTRIGIRIDAIEEIGFRQNDK